jgi:hypothetical protein
MSGHPNIFPLAGFQNSIMPEHLDGHNQQMVSSDLLRLEAISTCSSDLYPCMEWTCTESVDYSRKYYSTRALMFRELRLSDFEQSGLELVQFTADCLLCFIEPISYSRYLLKDTLDMSLSWDCLHPLLGRLVDLFDGRHNEGSPCGLTCHSQRHFEDEDSHVFQVQCQACKLLYYWFFFNFSFIILQQIFSFFFLASAFHT